MAHRTITSDDWLKALPTFEFAPDVPSYTDFVAGLPELTLPPEDAMTWQAFCATLPDFAFPSDDVADFDVPPEG